MHSRELRFKTLSSKAIAPRSWQCANQISKAAIAFRISMRLRKSDLGGRPANVVAVLQENVLEQPKDAGQTHRRTDRASGQDRRRSSHQPTRDNWQGRRAAPSADHHQPQRPDLGGSGAPRSGCARRAGAGGGRPSRFRGRRWSQHRSALGWPRAPGAPSRQSESFLAH